MTPHPMRIVVITGMSGSGKSVALNVLEDDGFYCIDNLPARFLLEVVMSLQDSDRDRVAVAVDVRSGLLADLRQAVAGMARFGHDVRVLFLNARSDTLVRRYSESRRPHPLADDKTSLLEAIQRGARGYVLKDVDAVALAAAIRAVRRGESAFDSHSAALVVRSLAAPAPARPSSPSSPELTAREREVLALLARGLSNEAIGRELYISATTAKFHVGNVMRKLAVSRRAEAVYAGSKLGLI